MPALFKVRNAEQTGLHFTNKLTQTAEFNMIKYLYFYNGAGIGAADFNNDGLTDIFFAANQSSNKMFINKGNLHFEDVSNAAQIPNDNSWSTGVSVADVNHDGLMDIYICRVGNFETLHSANQLLICKGINAQGIPVYTDEAEKYGLNFSGFSTQAAFFDYDLDGDLDMYLLNHSVHQNGTFAERKKFTNTFHPLSGDRLYRNDGDSFTDVTKSAGINSSAIGYGLGITVADINMDGFPDLYIGNDFHEDDYLYLNQGDGTFKETLNDHIMHTSKFSMGVDVADITNDGLPEIISLDMLPEDPYILKRSLPGDSYDIFNMKLNYGYNYQYSRNNLQLNNGNDMFSEVGCYAGIEATDWSWAPLLMDFNNDGLKDLFISNGIPKKLNDIDYVNYVSNDVVQGKIQGNNLEEKDLAVMEKFPEIKVSNKFYLNNGDATFKDVSASIDQQPGFSNGAVYADFDNDGDLDLVTNNINETATFYENTTVNKSTEYLQIQLTGNALNTSAVGAKVLLFVKDSIRTYENFPVRGFQSSMQTPVQVGLRNTKVDSIVIVWPDNTYEKLTWDSSNTAIDLTYRKGLPKFNYTNIHKTPLNDEFKDLTNASGLLYKHEENSFNEFDREPLIPAMLSAEGPALAVDDVNNDGLQDVFIGAAKRKKSALFLQHADGKFSRSLQTGLDADSMYEDVDAIFADINNDGYADLLVASGGNEFPSNDIHLQPRAYLNNGKGSFSLLQHAFDNVFVNASCIAAYDFSGDGFTDLFIGGRSVPSKYGEIPTSFLLQNDGAGHFKNVSSRYNMQIANAGMVTGACWTDTDDDGDNDLVISLQWGGIKAFINNGKSFETKELTTLNGWWNFVYPVDIDGDGDMDIIAGNLGLNSRLQANKAQPVKMYYNDFDDNGTAEQVVTYFFKNVEMPFANKVELEKQMPFLKKKFLFAEDFAKASLTEIFPAEKLQSAKVYKADYFSNAVLINNGNNNFTVTAMPWQAQLTPYRCAALLLPNEKTPGILLGGNFYESNVEMGRYDAGYGGVMRYDEGKKQLMFKTQNETITKGQVRHIEPIILQRNVAYILARNNDSLQILKQIKKTTGQ